MWRLIWVCTVCLRSFYGVQGKNGLTAPSNTGGHPATHCSILFQTMATSNIPIDSTVKSWTYYGTVLEINVFTCYMVLKVVGKRTHLLAITGGHVTAIVSFMKKKSIWSKALIMSLPIWNLFCLIEKKNYISKNWLVLPRNYFHNILPMCKF